MYNKDTKNEIETKTNNSKYKRLCNNKSTLLLKPFLLPSERFKPSNLQHPQNLQMTQCPFAPLLLPWLCVSGESQCGLRDGKESVLCCCDVLCVRVVVCCVGGWGEGGKGLLLPQPARSLFNWVSTLRRFFNPKRYPSSTSDIFSSRRISSVL